MTYREFYEAVEERIPGSFKIEVQTWNHRIGDGPETTWTVWDVVSSTRYRGPDPEAIITQMDGTPHTAVLPDDPCVVTEPVTAVERASGGDDVPF